MTVVTVVELAEHHAIVQTVKERTALPVPALLVHGPVMVWDAIAPVAHSKLLQYFQHWIDTIGVCSNLK